jgi:hypothetical protein
MVGFGRGLTGTPKDYTGLVASRNRQGQLEQLRAKAAKDKGFADIYKQTVVDDNKYLPYKVPAIKEKLAETIKRINESKANDDYAGAAQAINDFKQFSAQSIAEREDMDKLRDGYRTGKILLDRNPDEIYKAKSIEEVKKGATGDYFFNEEVQRIGASPIETVDLTKFYQDVAKTQTPIFNEKEKVTLNLPGGGTTVGYQQYYDESQFENQVFTGLNNNEARLKNAIYNFKKRADTEGMTPEQIQRGALQMATSDAKEFMKNNGYKFFRGNSPRVDGGSRNKTVVSVTESFVPDNIAEITEASKGKEETQSTSSPITPKNPTPLSKNQESQYLQTKSLFFSKPNGSENPEITLRDEEGNAFKGSPQGIVKLPNGRIKLLAKRIRQVSEKGKKTDKIVIDAIPFDEFNRGKYLVEYPDLKDQYKNFYGTSIEEDMQGRKPTASKKSSNTDPATSGSSKWNQYKRN